MDQVDITRAQLKAMAAKDLDYTIIDCNQDARMVHVEPTKHRGEGKNKWLQANGLTRDGKKL